MDPFLDIVDQNKNDVIVMFAGYIHRMGVKAPYRNSTYTRAMYDFTDAERECEPD